MGAGMKRIVLKGPVVFYQRDKAGKVLSVTRFEKGKPYEVADAIADTAFIKACTATVESIKPVRKGKKEEEADDGKSEASKS